MISVIQLCVSILIMQTVCVYGQNAGVKNKNGKLKKPNTSFPQTPMMELLAQTIAPNIAMQNPGDLFDLLRDKYPLPNGLKSPYTEYDYIIVGAGSAGCVLAARLSEDPSVTVLVLEVGKPENILTDIPSIAPYFQRTEYAWPYWMEPQPGVCLDNGLLVARLSEDPSVTVIVGKPLKNILTDIPRTDETNVVCLALLDGAAFRCLMYLGMENNRCYWPRGRAVGGTSVINYMIYTRGRPQEWDRIAADGNYGWSYKDVLHYYMKSERASLQGYEDSPYHSNAGELNVEFVPERTPLIDAFLEAGRELGHPTVDYNAPEQLGFGYLQGTIHGGKRVSAAKAFLHPTKRRPNLHILPMSTVTKVLIDPKSRVAYGVQYARNRLRYEVRARREVILSAGPIASPQLLMLSGIGPKNQLSRLGIPIIQDLPVGQLLYDHITFPGMVFTLNVTNISFNENREANLPTLLQWFQFGDTAVSTTGAAEGIGYIKTPVSDDPEDVPDIELISIGGSLVSDGGPTGSKAVRRGMMIREEVFDGAYGSIDDTDTWTAFPMLVHPKSVGYLELKNNNPFSYPRLYGNYLTDPSDAATFVASIRHVQALAATAPFQRLGAKIHRAKYPACRRFKFDTDEYWECAVRTLTATLHHQIATCKMGPDTDPLAVVDPELRVYGVARLRVVDSSIIPRTVTAHTNAPAIMIGEKAADMIKATWS